MRQGRVGFKAGRETENDPGQEKEAFQCRQTLRTAWASARCPHDCSGNQRLAGSYGCRSIVSLRKRPGPHGSYSWPHIWINRGAFKKVWCTRHSGIIVWVDAWTDIFTKQAYPRIYRTLYFVLCSISLKRTLVCFQ